MLIAEERDALVAELAQRPGHEKVRALLHRLLVAGLGAASQEIDFEKPAPEVRGRIDALLGRTVFELKSDLRRERRDAEDALARYLAQRESATGEHYTGIATDGADFTAFLLRGSHVVEVAAHRTDSRDSRALLVWMQSVVAIGEGLLPDPHIIKREFGRDSLAARRAVDDLAGLWSAVGHTPEARLKRALWGRLLGLAYGADVGDDALFMQHSYLVIVAKAVAWAAVIDAPPPDAAALLHGGGFANLEIVGQSEPDFFDWPLAATGGAELAMRIARQVNRFRLHDIQADILKALYEGLIDPDTRHDLGEYYTPDWLAARMIAEVVDNPLERRVMDPACGSGTFLFHAIRAVLASARAAGVRPGKAARLALDRVAGIDVHPVAVVFARVTCLLALAPVLRREHPGDVSLPVYLGDTLQWNLASVGERGQEPDLLADENVLEIYAPAVTLTEPRPRRLAPATLRFPAAVASDPALFDRLVSAMIDHGARAEPVTGFTAWIERNLSASAADRAVLRATYKVMRRLHDEGRDHIWGYVARNLARPVWLAAQKADVVVGNPPWVSFRYMASDFQRRFRDECQAARLWVGGKVATQQDLAGYFYLRAAMLYMRPEGKIALVMPYAAMSRRAYAPMRRGVVARAGQAAFRLRFTAAWTFGPEVWPLFPVPCCVLFAKHHQGVAAAPLPGDVRAFVGTLSRRDVGEAEAAAALEETSAPWPVEAVERQQSPYRDAFRNGATLVPRRLVLVEPVAPTGILPPNPRAPLVRGQVGNQDKRPWNVVKPPQCTVDRAFLRPVLLGESIAPFRALVPRQAVIPWDEVTGQLLNAKGAAANGLPRLARWLRQAEALWEGHKRSALSFAEQCDYYGKLSCQFPIAPLRVVYTKAGTNLAAATIRDAEAIIDHKLYWAAVESPEEALYLCGVLNSEALRAGVERYQSQGQWGARDFDKYVFNLPIQRFDAGDPLHRRLADTAGEAEKVAAAIALAEGLHFTRARRRIRAKLADHGIAESLERLVRALLQTE